MKTKKTGKTKAATPEEPAATLKEAAIAYVVSEPAMVRTQIYLSKREHDFVQVEASRRGQPMAALIREFIDEKMAVPDEVWTDNPLLQPAAPDPAWKSPEDGAMNHDHYVYGTPKKWMRRKGQWVETPPLPEDYYTNPKSRRAYDDEVNRGK